MYHPRNDIAIIGLSCVLPGSDTNKETPLSFWDMLKKGECGVKPIPLSRWNNTLYYDKDPIVFGKSQVLSSSWTKNVSLFDSKLFGISDKESMCMDPQQRILLERTFRAFENAGYTLEQIKGSKTGVYIGIMNQDYSYMQTNIKTSITTFSSTGLANSIISNRISYMFDLRGPSMTIDTACSSTLVCIHSAIQSLRKGETNMSVVGGINLLLIPRVFVVLTKLRILSGDGKSKAFDESADGYGRGEGCSFIILKRLEDAVKDGDKIYAVIKGSSICSDGKSSRPITQPNVGVQKGLFQDCLDDSRIDDKKLVQFVEAHGTGTVTGDGVEAESISQFYTDGREKKISVSIFCDDDTKNDKIKVRLYCEEKIRVGSVKTNIGHLEAAAGIVGVLKTVLSLYHKSFVPSLFFKKFPKSLPKKICDKLHVQTEYEPWPENKNNYPRLAAVNSFGYGGTNGQLIIQEYRVPQKQYNPKEIFDKLILTVSAHSKNSMKEFLNSHISYLSNIKDMSKKDLYDYCYTSSLKKNHLLYRYSVIGSNKNDFVRELENVLITFDKTASKVKKFNTVFLFPGQGSQVSKMGLGLLKIKIFKEHMEKIHNFVKSEYGWSLYDALQVAEEDSFCLWKTNVMIFAYQSSLSQVLINWGVEPDSIIGYSVGELCAGYISGAISLKEAIRVIWIVGTTIKKLVAEKSKCMAVVWGKKDRFEDILKKHKVEIACCNSLNCSTIAGEPENLNSAIKEMKEKLRINPQVLKNVKYPFHTSLMGKEIQQTILKGLESAFDETKGEKLKYKVYSPNFKRMVGEKDFKSPDFWWQNARNAVDFESQVKDVIKSYKSRDILFIEITPKAVLQLFINDFNDDKNTHLYVSSERKEKDVITDMLKTVSSLYQKGLPIKWENFYYERGNFIFLPELYFTKTPFWAESIESFRSRLLGPDFERHDELFIITGFERQIEFNTNIEDLLLIAVYNKRYVPSKWPLMKDHVFGGSMLIPGSYFVEVFISVAENICPRSIVPYSVKKVKFITACWFRDENLENHLRVAVKTVDELTFFVEIYNTRKSKKTLHSTAYIQYRKTVPKISIDNWKNIEKTKSYDNKKWYDEFIKSGFTYGERFTLVQTVDYHTEAVMTINVPKAVRDEIKNDKYYIHPGVIDAATQGIAVKDENISSSLPIACEEIIMVGEYDDESKLIAYVENISRKSDEEKGDVYVFNEKEELIVAFMGWECLSVESKLRPTLSFHNKIFVTDFRKLELPKTEEVEKLQQKKVVFVLNGYEMFSNDVFSNCMNVFNLKMIDLESMLQNIKINLNKFTESTKEIVLLVIPPKFWEISDLDMYKQILLLTEWFLLMIQTIMKLNDVLLGIEINVNILTYNMFNVKDVDDEKKKYISLVQSPLVGYFRVTRAESKKINYRLIDVDFDVNCKDKENLNSLYNEIISDSMADQVIIRNKEREVLYFKNLEENFKGDFENYKFVRSDCTYLLGGGTGSLGLYLTSYLVQHGAKNIVLISRRGVTTENDHFLKNLQQQCRIKVVKADLSQKNSVNTIQEEIPEDFPQIGGIFNLCMVLEDGIIENQTIERFKKVLDSKIGTTLNLLELVKKNELDFFVLFSSTTSFVGNRGQIAYGGGNSFYDVLSTFKNIQTNVISINYPPIGEVGFIGRNEKIAQRLKGMGYDLLSKTDLAKYLRYCIFLKKETTFSNFAVFNVSPPVFVKNASELMKREEWKDILEKWSGKFSLFKKSRRFESEETSLTTGSILKKIGEIMGFDLEEKDINSDLVSLGLDSIYAVDLRSYFTEVYKVNMPLSDLLNSEFTLKELIDKIQSGKKVVDDDGIGDKEVVEKKEEVVKILAKTERKIEEAPVHDDTQRPKYLVPIFGNSSNELKEKCDSMIKAFEGMSKFKKMEEIISLVDKLKTRQFQNSICRHSFIFDGVDHKVTTNLLIEEIENRESSINIVFMFTGQGQQRIGLARELYYTNSQFRREIDMCCSICEDIFDRTDIEEEVTLKELLLNSSNQKNVNILNETRWSQLVIFVVEYCIAKLFIEIGIKPSVMIGHSIGEYVCSCIAGVFTLYEIISIIIVRGRAMNKCVKGLMLAVKTEEQIVRDMIKSFNDKLEDKNDRGIQICLVNAPNQIVVGGMESNVKKFVETLKTNKIKSTILRTKHAFHSCFMDKGKEDLLNIIHNTTISDPQIKYLSNVTGKWITIDDVSNPEYFANHMCSTVYFSQNVLNLFDYFVKSKSRFCCIEIGPGKVISNLMKNHLKDYKEKELLSKRGKFLTMFPDRDHKVDDFTICLSKLWNYGVLFSIYDFNRLMGFPEEELLYRLNFSQERIWIIEEFEKSSSYHLTTSLKSHKSETVEIIEKIYNTIIERHPILQCSIEKTERNIPYHKVHKDVKLKIEIFDELKDERLKDLEKSGLLKETLRKLTSRKIDFSKPPLFKVFLLIFKDVNYVHVNFHHIVLDGYCLSLFSEESVKVIERFADENVKLPRLPKVSVFEALYEERVSVKSETQKKKLKYWLNRLDKDKEYFLIPSNLKLSEQEKHRNDEFYMAKNTFVQKLDFVKIESLVKSLKTSRASIIASVLGVLLFHLSIKEKQISFGVVEMQDKLDQRLFGSFVNLLPIQCDIKEDLTFHGLCNLYKRLIIESRENSFPFDVLLKELKIPRDEQKNNLFQILFNFRTFKYHHFGKENEFADLLRKSQFDVEFICDYKIAAKEVNIKIIFDNHLYTYDYIKDIFQTFEYIIEQSFDNTNQAIKDYKLLNEKQSDVLLRSCNIFKDIGSARMNWDDYKNMFLIFEKMVSLYPTNNAIFDENLGKTTYKELSYLSGKISYYLKKECGVKFNDIIAVFCNRIPNLVVILLSIIRSSCGYLPLDPDYCPKEYFYKIIGSSKPKILITTKPLYTEILEKMLVGIGEEIKIVFVEDILDNKKEEYNDESKFIKPENLDSIAYCEFTSGSTGTPKGVKITNRNIISLLDYCLNDFQFKPNSSCLMFHSFTFDLHAYEIWGTLLSGGCLVNLDAPNDVEKIWNMSEEYKLSHLSFTPTVFRSFVQICKKKGKLNDLKMIMLCGEVLPFNLFKNWYTIYDSEQPVVINSYGITETTIISTFRKMVEEDQHSEKSYIGGPIPNNKFLVLNRFKKLLPCGVPGEIFISGEALSIGYLNENKTKERFFKTDLLKNLYPNDKLCEVIYQTGDCSVFNGEDFEFIGRLDNQLSIFGYRIESEHVESVILETFSDHIKKVAVIPIQSRSGNPILTGFIEVRKQIGKKEIISTLSSKLPRYMIPKNIIFMNSIPMTRNNKINRSEIIKLVKKNGIDFFMKKKQGDDEDPEGMKEKVNNHIEYQIMEIFRDTFGENVPIGLRSNFFMELAGGSLQAIQVMHLINQRFGLSLNPNMIYLKPSIKDLCEYIKENSKTEETQMVLLVRTLKRKGFTILICPPAGGIAIQFSSLAKSINHQLDIDIFSVEDDKMVNNIDEVIKNYADTIIKNIPLSRHLFIVGFSLGGSVGYKLIQYFKKNGHYKCTFILVDSNLKNENEDVVKPVTILLNLVSYYNRISSDHNKVNISEKDLIDLSEAEQIEKISNTCKYSPFNEKRFVQRYYHDIKLWQSYKPEKPFLENTRCHYIGCEETKDWAKGWVDYFPKDKYYVEKSIDTVHHDIIRNPKLFSVICKIVGNEMKRIDDLSISSNDIEKYLKKVIHGFEDSKFFIEGIDKVRVYSERVFMFSSYIFNTHLSNGDHYLRRKKVLPLNDNLDTGNPSVLPMKEFSEPFIEEVKMVNNYRFYYSMISGEIDDIQKNLLGFMKYINLLKPSNDGDFKILLGTGTSHLSDCIMRVTIQREEDVILVPTITYGFLLPSIEIQKGVIHFIPTKKENEYKMTPKMLEEQIRKKNIEIVDAWMKSFIHDFSWYLENNGLSYFKYKSHIESLSSKLEQFKDKPYLIDLEIQKFMQFIINKEKHVLENLDVTQLPSPPRVAGILYINPTLHGKFYTLKEIRELGRILNEYRVNIIEDLAYLLLFLNRNLELNSFLNCLDITKNIDTYCLFGLSKPFALSDIRIGVCVGRPPVVETLEKIVYCTVFQVSSMIQKGLKGLFQTPPKQIMNYINNNSFNNKDGYVLKKDVMVSCIEGSKANFSNERSEYIRNVIDKHIDDLLNILEKDKIPICSRSLLEKFAKTYGKNAGRDCLKEAFMKEGVYEYFDITAYPDAGFFIILDSLKLIKDKELKELGIIMNGSIDVASMLYYFFGVRCIPEEVLGETENDIPSFLRVSFSVDFQTIIWSFFLIFIGLSQIKCLKKE